MTRYVRLYKRWLRYVLLDLVERQLPELRAMVRSFAPDIICVDPLAYAGVIVAETEHLPWVALGTQLAALAPPSWSCDYVDLLRDQHDRRTALFARHGVRVDFRLGDAVSPWLNTMPTTEAHFPPSLAQNDHAVFVGPCVLTKRGLAETQGVPGGLVCEQIDASSTSRAARNSRSPMPICCAASMPPCPTSCSW